MDANSTPLTPTPGQPQNRFSRIINAINRFLTTYLDRTADRCPEAETLENIRSGIEFKGSTIWILIFAIFIASLGLNTNSTAVIIGAMLISPLMGPIMGIGLGLGIYDFELIKKSFRNLAVATLFSILTSAIYFLLSPLNDARSELLARTSPTIYDVLIAFFGGMAGIVALSTKFKGNVIPGVAIATALMPPLCTAGFGLATGNLYYFLGAFYLYCINSVFIAFATTLGVKFMHFSRKEFMDPKRKDKVQRIVYLILFVTMVPSFFITYDMVRTNYFQTQATHYINSVFKFPRTQVLNRTAEITHGVRKIEVSLIGQELPQDTIALLEALLPQYGLKGTHLYVSQGFTSSQQAVNVDQLSNTMFQEIYKVNQKQLEQQTHTIDSLENRIAQTIHYDTLGQVIAPEIRILFPEVGEIGISKLVYTKIYPLQLDTITMAIVEYKKPMASEDAERFKAWLQARLAVNNLRILSQ